MDKYLYFNVYSIPVIVACIATAILGYWAWNKGNKQGQKYFSYLMISSFIYSFFYLMELSTDHKELMITFLKFQYLGSHFVAPFLLLFILKYSDNDWQLKRWQFLSLYSLPIILLIAVFTNEYHFSFYESWDTEFNGLFLTLITEKGILYWIIQFYTLSLTIVAIFFLIKMYSQVPRMYYKQINMMFSAIIISWGIYFLYMIDFAPYNLDIIPFAFAFSGILIYIGFVKYGFFEIVPIAYKSLFDNLSNGVMVFDAGKVLITTNKGIMKMLGLNKDFHGKNHKEIIKHIPELKSILEDKINQRLEEICFHSNGDKLWFTVNLTFIEKSYHKKGFLLIFNEITREKTFQQDLIDSRANAKLNELRLRTIIDNAGDLFLTIDTNLNLTYCSTNSKDLIGYDHEYLLGKNINLLIDSEQKLFYEKLEAAIKSSLKSNSIDFEIKTAVGEPIWFSANLAPISFMESSPDSILMIARNIAKQKKIESDIYALSDEYEKVFNGTQDAMFLIEIADDDEFRFVRNNETHQRLTGLSLDNFRGKTPVELLGEDVGNALIQNYKRCVLLNETINYEEKIVLPAATRIWSTTLTPVTKADNKSYIVGSSLDITYRVDAQNAVIASENKFRSLVENASDIIFSLDLQGRFTYISPNSKAILGYNPEEYLYKPFYLLLHPDDGHINLQALTDLISSGKGMRNITYRIRQSDGKYKWHITSASPLVDNITGEVSIFGVTRDISEIKAAERALRKSEKQAKDLARQYETILNNQSVYIVKTDSKGNFTYVNQYFIDELGEGEELIGKHSLDYILPEDLEVCMETIKKCFKQPGIPHPVVLRKAGPVRRIRGGKWELKGIVNEDDEIEEILCVGFDITDQLESLKRLERLLEVTSDQNQKLRSFTYIISHNIRSHSANLSGLADLILDSNDEDEKSHLLTLLKSSADQLDETLVNLNEIISINENVGKLKSLINIEDRINKTLEILHGEVEKNKVTIIKQIPENPFFYSIPSYIDSALLNMISNAIKYRSVDKKPEVKILVSRIEDKIELVFQDNGRGLDLKKYGKKLFGMYKTFHGNEDAKGLGLFITKAQVEAMGGSITVESEVGKGSMFKIVLNAKN